jgi:predicted signal transduction protein with EAL and GGDEF domain
LVEIFKRLRACVRSSDTVARLGGDEFGVLLDGLAQMSEVPRAIERIRTELQAPVPLKKGDIFTCPSIGVALSTSGYSDSDTPLRDADTAMYRAKSMGPGNYAMFDPSMHESAVLRLKLDNDLRRGIERGELRLHYQPIVLTDTGASSRNRWWILFAVWRCFRGRSRSSARIASITPTHRSSFGFLAGCCRR